MKFEEIGRHSYLVLGAARSGIAAAKLLKSHKCDVFVADQKAEEKAAEVRKELDAAGIRSFWGEDCMAALARRNVMILSPGIPDSNPIVRKALGSGVRVISEIELAAAFVGNAAKVVAITGTNGKTTTTAWIAHLLKTAGYNAVLGGNIGDAWSNSVDLPQNRNANTVFVVESSSFQLERIEDFRPDVTVLTNLAPDHLDRYAGYEDYVAAKRNILRNLGPEQVFVLNHANADSIEFAKGARCRKLRFYAEGPLDGAGAFADGDKLFIRDESGHEHTLIRRSELPLPGLHNLENALAAALAAFLAGADLPAINSGLRDFQGVEHRIELCGERNGVKFYNDSKATNVDSLEKALKSFAEPIVLIAGGRDKHSDYDSLKGLVKQHVKRAVTIGEAAPLIEASWSGTIPFERSSDMKDAVKRAAIAAEPGEVVLLSPACSSYDMYNNYEERGRDFKARVKELLSKP